MSAISSEKVIHARSCTNNYWSKISRLISKKLTNWHVDSTNKTIFNPSPPSPAQQGAFNPKTSIDYFQWLRGAQNTEMTNSRLVFTDCAITVYFFSALNIMHYLSGNLYSLIVAACDRLVSIYRFFNIWLFNTFGSGLLLLLLPLCAQCMCSSWAVRGAEMTFYEP